MWCIDSCRELTMRQMVCTACTFPCVNRKFARALRQTSYQAPKGVERRATAKSAAAQGQPDVLDKQFDQAVEVGVCHGVGEPRDEPAFDGIRLTRGPAAATAAAAGVVDAGVGEVVLDGGAGAFQGTAARVSVCSARPATSVRCVSFT